MHSVSSKVAILPPSELLLLSILLKKFLPGDTCTEEEEDTDADNHADGKGVKPASSSTTSSPPVPPVVAPAVGRCLSTNILKIKLFLFGIDVIIWNILNDGKHYLP